jgi:hypothetical protein
MHAATASTMSPASTDPQISKDMVFTLQSKHNNVVINPRHRTFLEKLVQELPAII